MPSPSAASIHALVEAVDVVDMLSMLESASKKADVLAGIEAEAMAQALIVMLREAALTRLQAERAAAVLTRRERQIAVLLVRGLTNAAMAAELNCTVRTVRAHMENMQRKTGTSNKTALLAVVKGWNIGF
ncbi:LuxR C-terminal-related transcriptional regulator [Vogesella indigofera]|uniref:LuxR C-terminal-related transcriptional regulator n=1 Tax=Vogesella indigofera TaxID=45465 RepID=UPI00234FA60D|nr:LuxR C-terminal-related transcriptional regulator [Vogesella indigofera]MDC7707733.1 LuxR C-terminal-related transcriptional regulator [Vogesella indigofera]